MGMMYQVISKALEDAGLFDQYHPQDFLNFYCLGQREAPSSSSSSQTNQPTDNRGLVYLFLHSGKPVVNILLHTKCIMHRQVLNSDGFKIKRKATNVFLSLSLSLVNRH